MLAYKSASLDNRIIKEQAKEALAKQCITETEYQRILETYPVTLYTPNFFIRTGLFLLTALASLCCLGLFLLMIGGNDRTLGGGLIFFGVLIYGVLELFIHLRGIYRAGIDDALLWMGGAVFLTGVNFYSSSLSAPDESLIVLLLALVGLLRYADRLMGLVAYGAALCLLFYMVGETAMGRVLLPFIVIGSSALLYLLFTRLSVAVSLRFYHSSLVLLRAAALLSGYAAGNYYIVRELNAFVMHSSSDGVALGSLWWGLTVAVPVFYIVNGIRKKDIVFLWMGLGLLAGAVFTLRYYYHVLPAELAMLIAGAVLIGGAWYLIRYLHEPKYGFTSADTGDSAIPEGLPVEGLIMAESFKPGAADADGFQYGGGTTGGGGSGGTY